METPVQNASEEALESLAPILDQQKLEMYMHRLSMDQNLVKGIDRLPLWQAPWFGPL